MKKITAEKNDLLVKDTLKIPSDNLVRFRKYLLK